MASNNIQNLDPALERRFTVRYRFKMPDSQARKSLWQVLKPLDVAYAPEVGLQGFANKYPFTGAQIEKCLAMAAALAIGDHEGNLVLDESLICRCAGEQFSVFLSEGIVKMEPLENSKGGPERIHLEATSFAVEDSKWVTCFRTDREKINRFFPERSNNGSILLALGEVMLGKRYANELSRQLGFRLLRASVSDILDLRQREMQKYMPLSNTILMSFSLLA